MTFLTRKEPSKIRVLSRGSLNLLIPGLFLFEIYPDCINILFGYFSIGIFRTLKFELFVTVETHLLSVLA